MYASRLRETFRKLPPRVTCPVLAAREVRHGSTWFSNDIFTAIEWRWCFYMTARGTYYEVPPPMPLRWMFYGLEMMLPFSLQQALPSRPFERSWSHTDRSIHGEERLPSSGGSIDWKSSHSGGAKTARHSKYRDPADGERNAHRSGDPNTPG